MRQSVYKYTAINQYSLENIEKSQIAFTSISQLNDPFEGVGRYSFKLGDSKKNNSFQRNLEKQLNEKLSDKASEILKKEWRAFCAAQSPLNVLMWAHYANNHCGICIEYELKDIKECSIIGKVKYDRKLFRADNTFDDIKELLFHKYSDWSYEQEIRCLYHLSNDELTYLEYDPELFRIKDEYYDYFFSGKEKLGTMCFVKAPRIILHGCRITGIYFGLKVTDDERRKVLNRGKRDGIKFYQITQNSNSYELNCFSMNN